MKPRGGRHAKLMVTFLDALVNLYATAQSLQSQSQ
jgi:hypothetical protein